jgi:exonuclease III
VEILFRNFDPEDPASRSITVRTPYGFDLINAYFPNGQSVGSEKYAYKLDWIKKAKAFIQSHWSPSDKLVVVGDFNIAPDDRERLRSCGLERTHSLLNGRKSRADRSCVSWTD